MSEHDEELLGGMRLRAPSQALDTRIEKLIAARAAQPAPSRGISLWQCVAACAACGAAAFLGALALSPRITSAPSAGPATTEVHYIVQTQQQPYDVFDWTKYPKNVAPNSMLPVRRAMEKNNDAI